MTLWSVETEEAPAISVPERQDLSLAALNFRI